MERKYKELTDSSDVSRFSSWFDWIFQQGTFTEFNFWYRDDQDAVISGFLSHISVVVFDAGQVYKVTDFKSYNKP